MTLAPGGSQQFSVVGIMSDGSTTSPAINWTATGGTVSGGGLYTAGSSGGSYQVTATEPTSGLSATATVTVTAVPPPPPPPTLTQLLVSPSSVSLSIGATQQFSVTGLMSDGSTVAVSVSWSGTGGTGTASGLYTAGPVAGSFQVTATDPVSGLTGVASVTITAAPPPPPPPPTLVQIIVSPATVTLDVSATQQFSATGLMSDGSTQSLSVTWSATGGSVTAGALYTAGSSAGVYQITATDPGTGVTGSAQATINPPPATLVQIQVAPPSVSLAQGATQQFSATGFMSDGSTQGRSVSWSATGGTVSSAGQYTAGSTAGSFQVTATDIATGMTGNASVSVNSGSLGAPSSVTVALGPTLASQMIQLDVDWPGVPGATQYDWRFFPTQAGMSPLQNGQVGGSPMSVVVRHRSVSSYTANVCITARNATQTGPETCGSVTVPPWPNGGGGGGPTLQQVVVAPSSVTLAAGGPQQFTATGVMSDGSTTGVSVNWTAAGGAINGSGFYTAGSTAGSYQVTATEPSSGISGTASVTITNGPPPPPTLTQVVVSPSSVTVNSGQTRQFSAAGLLSDGSTQTISVSWSSTGGSVTGAGLYTAGGSSGAYQVTASHAASGLSGSASITISSGPPPPPPPPPPPGGLVINKDFSTVTSLSSVGGFFWDCQATASCPNGETAKANGGIQLVSDATYGQVLRINQEASGTISYRGTVKGRFSVAPDSVVWFQSLVRYASNWDAAVGSSYKYNFLYISNGGTQRLQKCCGGPGGQMSHGFGGGTAYGGNPPLKAGSDNSGWWTSSQQWVRVTGWYIREGGDSSGWLIEELGGAGRHAFWGGRRNGVPEALNGTNTSGHGPMVVYRVSQGENINNPPAQDTHILYATIRAWSGVMDPLGLLNQVR